MPHWHYRNAFASSIILFRKDLIIIENGENMFELNFYHSIVKSLTVRVSVSPGLAHFLFTFSGK